MPVAQSVIENWRAAVLAIAIAVLLLVFIVDVDPMVRFGVGGIVFVLWMWWFVNTGVTVFDRLGK